MASLKDIISGGTNLTGGNSGLASGYYDYQPFIGIMLSYGKFISKAELANLKTTLNTAMTAASADARLIPFFGFEEANDKSKEKTVQTTQYNTEVTLLGKKSKFEFKILRGGLYIHQRLKVHSDNCTQAYLVDAKNRMCGWTDGSGAIYPYDLNQFYVDDLVLPTPQAISLIPFELAFADQDQLLKKFAWTSADSENLSLKDLKGLTDVELIEKVAISVAVGAASVTIAGKVGSNYKSLRGLYGAALAKKEAWVVYNETQGAAVAIAANPTEDAVNDAYVVVIAAGAYGAVVSGDVLSFRLAAMNVLSGAPVSLPAAAKIESNKLLEVAP